MKRKYLHHKAALLAIALLSAFFLMTIPVEDADAWPVHFCLEAYAQYNSSGEWVVGANIEKNTGAWSSR